MNFEFTALKFIILSTGFIVELWRRKNKFDRSNILGIEQFSGYGNKLLIKSIELIMIFSSIFLVALGFLI